MQEGKFVMSDKFDVIIIGAGIMGCSAAFQLAQRGLKVGVLEKENIGAGSTGKSSAIIRQHYSNELTVRMALYSLRVFQNFKELVGEDCGFRQTGFVVIVGPKDGAGLEANVAMQRRLGIQTELLSPSDLQEMIPGLEVGDLAIVAYEAESGYADPNSTVNAYAHAARRLGAKFYLNTPVTDVCFEGGRVVGVETPTGSFAAPQVLNCAGPWGARVAQMAGLHLPINSCRVQVAFFRRPAGYESDHPVIADFIHAAYFRPETGQLTLAGLVDPAESNAIVNPDCYREQVDGEFVLDAGERLIRRYPPLEMGQHTGGYAGLYAITPDWHPIIDELPAGSGFFTCAGFSGHGFKLGPAVGLMVADLLTGQNQPEFDPYLFRFSRYVEEAPIQGQYEYSIAG
jgi:glycine/D-amino acid oxidase-like deaminating enzyme